MFFVSLRVFNKYLIVELALNGILCFHFNLFMDKYQGYNANITKYII